MRTGPREIVHPTTESSCARAASLRVDCLDLAQYRNYAGPPRETTS
jgi:hypothetical protein